MSHMPRVPEIIVLDFLPTLEELSAIISSRGNLALAGRGRGDRSSSEGLDPAAEIPPTPKCNLQR